VGTKENELWAKLKVNGGGAKPGKGPEGNGGSAKQKGFWYPSVAKKNQDKNSGKGTVKKNACNGNGSHRPGVRKN